MLINSRLFLFSVFLFFLSFSTFGQLHVSLQSKLNIRSCQPIRPVVINEINKRSYSTPEGRVHVLDIELFNPNPQMIDLTNSFLAVATNGYTQVYMFPELTSKGYGDTTYHPRCLFPYKSDTFRINHLDQIDDTCFLNKSAIWLALYDSTQQVLDAVVFAKDRKSLADMDSTVNPISSNSSIKKHLNRAFVSFNAIPKSRKSYLYWKYLSVMQDSSFQRIPDGEQWASTPLDISYNGLNDPLSIVNNCTGTAEVIAVDGHEPYNYKWSRRFPEYSKYSIIDSTMFPWFEVYYPSGGKLPLTRNVISRTNKAENLRVGLYRVTVVDSLGSRDSVDFSIDLKERMLKLRSDTGFCKGASVLLDAGSDFDSYYWNTGEKSAQLTVDQTGTYIVTASSNCTKTDTFNLSVYPLPYVKSIDKSVNAQLTIDVGGGTPAYLYSLSNFPSQWFGTFLKVNAGDYTLKISDSHDCSVDTSFTIDENPFSFVNYFTPNGDGVNDTWEISGIEKYPETVIKIYDRFGTLLSSYKGSDKGWDGICLSKQMPADDYWYLVKIPGITKTYNGHFSLVR